MAGLGAARHEEVACALGGRLEQAGGLDLHEVAAVERLADGEGEVGAKLEVRHHLRTPEVEVAIAKAHVLGGVDMVLDLERGGPGGVENLDAGHVDLDGTGVELVVVLPLGTLVDGSGDHDRPLGADGLRGVEGLRVAHLGVEGDLRHARAVAEVDEDEAAVVAAVPDPAGEGDLLADVALAELSAGAGVHGVRIHFVPLVSAVPCRNGRLPSRRRRGVDSVSPHAISDCTTAPVLPGDHERIRKLSAVMPHTSCRFRVVGSERGEPLPPRVYPHDEMTS